MIGLIVAVLVLLLVSSSVYIVNEFERAVVLRFGEMVKADVPPGIHFKVPYADRVRKFDGRVLTADARPESFFTVENKRLIVDSFAKWRIRDVDVYYRATRGDERLADERLAQRIGDGLRNHFGRRTLHEVVSGERDQLMAELTKTLNETALVQLGVEVIDVRVKRIDLPADVSQSVFYSMGAARVKEASEHRAVGREQAEIIRAAADFESAVVVANAYREAELRRGEGDAQAAAIFASAYNKDPEFYAFVRSLNAYRSTFASRDDLMVIDPSSEFFRYLTNPLGQN
jgi:membrane protease subunit HflC